MKFFEGDLHNAISKRKIFSSAFIVFVEARDEESMRFRKVLEEENTIPAKEYIAFKISPTSDSYKHFLAIYGDVLVPSVFIIGNDGQPIKVLSSFESREEFISEIKQALEIHKSKSSAQRRIDRDQMIGAVQILLKLPGGETAVVEFSESSTLREIKTFIKDSLQVKEPFHMITPFPRKVFTDEEEGKTLVELQLCPASTVLVVPIERNKIWTPQFISSIIFTIYITVSQMLRRFKEWFSNFVSRRSR